MLSYVSNINFATSNYLAVGHEKQRFSVGEFYTYRSQRVSDLIWAQSLKQCFTCSLACSVRNSGIMRIFLRLIRNEAGHAR